MERIVRNISVVENMVIDFQAICGQERASARLERLFKTPEMLNINTVLGVSIILLTSIAQAG
jgi:hypothetical protein